MRRPQGFTILELMIVVAVIAIIAAIAMPSLTNARKSGYEARAIGICKLAMTINEQYKTRFGSYAPSEQELSDAGLLLNAGGGGRDDGDDGGGGRGEAYEILYQGSENTWTLTATPNEPGISGDRYFYVDQTGVIRFSLTAEADETSDPIE